MMGRKCLTLMVLCQFATGIFLRLSIFKGAGENQPPADFSIRSFFLPANYLNLFPIYCICLIILLKKIF